MRYELPRIEPFDDIIYDGEALRFERRWDDDTLALTRLRAGVPFRLDDGELPTAAWFLEEMAAGRLRIESAHAVRRRAARKPEVDSNDPKFREAARVQFVLRTIDESGCTRSNGAIRVVLEAAFTPEIVARYGAMPPPSTARKWLARGVVRDRALKECRPSNGRGARRSKLDDEVLKLRTDAAIHYWSARAITINDAHADHVSWVAAYNKDREADGLEAVAPCGIEWLRQRINELETREAYAAKFGEKAAAARFDANGLGTRSTQILELGIIDHQTFDSFCGIDEINGDLLPVGRPTVTAILDDHSECIVAAVLHVTPPSLFNALDAIKRANRPKMRQTEVGADKRGLLASIYGRFDTVHPDNAWEFVGVSGQDNLHDLGTSIDWARAGRPKDKAKLERFWGTLNRYLANKLPGAVFDPKLMRELGYDPMEDRVVLLSDLRDLLAEAVAYYHIEINTGMNVQPARLWEKGVKARGAIPVIADDRQIDQIMGMVAETTLTTAGVCLFGRLWYNDQAAVSGLLNSMAGTSPKGRGRSRVRTARVRVKVKYSPGDLSVVQVYDHVRHEYVELPCREEYVRGLSRKHHEVLESWTAAQNLAFNTPEERKLARATLNRLICQAAPDLAMRYRRKFAELVGGGIADDVGVGRTGVAYAPSSYSGMAPVIGHTTALQARSDDGRLPAGPPRRKAKRGTAVIAKASAAAKRPASTKTVGSLPRPETGRPASFDVMPRHPLGRNKHDWGGLT